MSKLLKGVWRRMLRVAYPLYEPDRPKLDWDHWRIAANTVLEKVEPPALPATAERVRRNLLALSTLAFVFVIGGLATVPDGIQINGVKLPALDPIWIVRLISAALFYQVIHYCWLFSDSADSWRLKLSGLRADSRELGNQSQHKRAVKPKFQTLHEWWNEHATHLESWSEIESTLMDLRGQLNSRRGPNDPDSYMQVLEKIGDIRAALDKQYLGGSLANFDNFHKHLTRSQMLRWLILDYYLPVGFGTASILGLMFYPMAL